MSCFSVVIFYLLFALSLASLLRLLPVSSGWARATAACVSFCVLARYAVWRASNMPAPVPAIGALWTWGFGALEFATLIYEAWTGFVLVRRPDHTREADGHERRLRSLAHLPTVDVFIATYDEPLAILEQTIAAALRLDYPRHLLRVIVGDDGDRPALRELAMRLGADYMARPGDGMGGKIGGRAKGGNDRYVFSKSRGEYIILLDADFCLRPEFLYRTLGFLLFRTGIGLVQTPQRYSNSDAVSLNLQTDGFAPDDQHFFMTIGEPSRDAWGNGFCTGTACVVSRRAARLLDARWGFPEHTISEDLELSYALAGKGFRTLYLNEALASGLAPESVLDFIKQRVRWCAGTVQNLFAPTGPIRGNLRLIDRVFYCEGVLYWLGSVFTVMIVLAPAVFWFTGISAIPGNPEAAATTVLPYLISRELILYWRAEGRVPPVLVNVRRTLAAFHVSAAFFQALLRPQSPVFKVATKGQSRNRSVVHVGPFLLFASIGFATAVGMTLGLLGRTPAVLNSDFIPLNVLWSAASALVCALCAFASIDQPLHASQGECEVTRSRPFRIAAELTARLVLGPCTRRREY